MSKTVLQPAELRRAPVIDGVPLLRRSSACGSFVAYRGPKTQGMADTTMRYAEATGISIYRSDQ